jgi:hypothetical protein
LAPYVKAQGQLAQRTIGLNRYALDEPLKPHAV